MQTLNEAIEGAALFQDMLRKTVAGATSAASAASATKPTTKQLVAFQDPEVVAWNAEADRKKAEKKARKRKAIDDARSNIWPSSQGSL